MGEIGLPSIGAISSRVRSARCSSGSVFLESVWRQQPEIPLSRDKSFIKNYWSQKSPHPLFRFLALFFSFRPLRLAGELATRNIYNFVISKPDRKFPRQSACKKWCTEQRLVG